MTAFHRIDITLDRGHFICRVGYIVIEMLFLLTISVEFKYFYH